MNRFVVLFTFFKTIFVFSDIVELDFPLISSNSAVDIQPTFNVIMIVLRNVYLREKIFVKSELKCSDVFCFHKLEIFRQENILFRRLVGIET